MLRLTPNDVMTAIRRGGLAAGLAAAAALTGPFHYKDLHLPFPDTVAHAMMAYALTLLAFGALPRWRATDLVRIGLGLSVGSEMIQALVGREMSLHDALGDGIGVACAYAPVAMGRLRELARTHPDLTFIELRRLDRRRGRPSRAVLVLERIVEA